MTQSRPEALLPWRGEPGTSVAGGRPEGLAQATPEDWAAWTARLAACRPIPRLAGLPLPVPETLPSTTLGARGMEGSLPLPSAPKNETGATHGARDTIPSPPE